MFTDMIGLYNNSIFSHSDVLASKAIEFGGEKTQNKGYYTVQGHSRSSKSSVNRKPVCDFLLVINSNWHPISYHRVIAAYCSNFGLCVFWAIVWVGGNVKCSSWAHWKAPKGLPISVNWTFFARCYGWGVTSENRSKIGDFTSTWSVWPKISGRRGRPNNYFFTVS